MNTPDVSVEAYAGYKGEETPRAFTLDGIRLAITDVIDRWYTDIHCYFRVRASDDQRYVLRYHFGEGFWELVMQEQDVEK
ncbi:MAG: hypothetical protein EWM72_01760 [Nitrospira sp.]|nr:MAG: hypothetical protein EWM72_01760 [Nitrospira sp.]